MKIADQLFPIQQLHINNRPIEIFVTMDCPNRTLHLAGGLSPQVSSLAHAMISTAVR